MFRRTLHFTATSLMLIRPCAKWAVDQVSLRPHQDIRNCPNQVPSGRFGRPAPQAEVPQTSTIFLAALGHLEWI